ncbi:MAG: DNA helicase RecQ [Oscillospiraceae bacterium]|nr:DNA helicase RecQ [Oscillospiraceae bacterium]
MDKNEVLRKYFGHTAFRGGQEQLVDCILSGKDCLGVMPTGAGKSICFQVPALMMNGTTVVISPLISLMRDQVNALRENGISAACINSSASESESRETFLRASSGDLKILYVAPERLETEGFKRLCERLEIPLVAVDEAHCVSHWGQDFRPSYLKISGFVSSLKKRPVIAAFTATATDIVKNDIVSILGLREPLSLTTGFDRPNLYFEVRKPDSKDAELLKILRDSPGSAIVYCATRKNVESVCEMLKKNGINAAMYHAGFNAETRKTAQDDFLYDRVDVMVATNAFGMGIDKSNVSLVVHYNMPKDVESYYQEAGRAGRDGSAARCVLLFNYGDVELAKYMIDVSHEDANLDYSEQKALKERDMKRLRKMTNYCDTTRCLREFILDYFGEKSNKHCSNCSNCEKDFKLADVTIEAQKILSCVFRVKQRGKSASKTVISLILTGSRDKRVLDFGFDELSTYGIMSDVPRKKITEIINFLEGEGYISIVGEYNSCELTPKADEFIKSKKSLVMRVSEKSARVPVKVSQDTENELFQNLRKVRRNIASVLGVPPYVVFSDATLRDMTTKLPRTHNELLEVSGVGELKAEKYGKKFLSVINDFIVAQNPSSE